MPQWLANLLAVLWPGRPKPAPMYVVSIEELPKPKGSHMPDKLKITISLPPASAPDVVSRELKTVVGSAEPILSTPQLTDPLTVVRTEEGVLCHLELVDIDNAGNRSEPRTLDFTASDTIAPGQPGEMAVLSVEEDFSA